MRIFPLVALLALLASAAAAQPVDQVDFFRLPDNTPRSTRSAAIGNALDPLSDDFTINPATAVSVKKPMLHVQGERQSNAIPFGNYDRAGNLITPRTWLERDQFTLVSAAMPLKGFTAGIYYAVDPRMKGPGLAGYVLGPFGEYTPAQCPNQCFEQSGGPELVFDRTMKRTGIAGAWKHGGLAVGIALELQDLEESYEVTRIFVRSDSLMEQTAERLFRRIDDRALVPNVGVRYAVSPRVALAASYQRGAKFDRATSVCTLALAPYDWQACTSPIAPLAHSALHTPSTYRASAGINVTDRLRAVGEAVHRGYSSLAQDDYSILGVPYRFDYHDVTELHAGLEYRVASLPLALRAGWWSDPARLEGTFLPVTRSLTHYTAGAAIDLRNGTSVDFAYDRSDDRMSRALVAGVTFR